MAAIAAAGWAGWRMFGPDGTRSYPPPQTRPIRVPGRSVFVGDAEFFVREAGPVSAATIVLIHGWAFDGEMTYFRIIEPLAEERRVVVPDMRNHGKSDWIRGGYDVVDLADEVAGILDAIDVTGATVVGYSLGGLVAQMLAARHPALVSQLVLAATAARPVPSRRLLTRLSFWLGAGLAHVSTVEATRITATVLRRVDAIEAAHERWLEQALRRRDPSLYFQAGAAAWRFDSRAWIGSLRIPITVVVPTGDWLIPPAAQRELALMAGAQVVELPGAGHESIMTHQDEYVKLLLQVTSGDG